MASSSNHNQLPLTLEHKPEKKPALFLLDGMALVYRAFFALQRADMRTRDGLPTGAVYGFLTTLLRIFESYSPEYLAIAFDSREKTFRHQLYPDYKANRPAPPEDLVRQLDTIFELVGAMHIPLLRQPGLEADDLIGSASRTFEESCDIFIVTPDKDMTQLIHEGVTMLKPGKSPGELTVFGPPQLKEEFGITPDQFIDFLTLTGDTSDNIPGAKGIGPKTASKLLNTFGTLEGIMENIAEIAPKARKSLQEFLPSADLVRQLVTIRTDIDLATPLSELACNPTDGDRLLPLLQRLELKSIMQKLPLVFPDMTADPAGEDNGNEADPLKRLTNEGYRLIDSAHGLKELVATLEKLSSFAIDTETTSLDTRQAELVGISISWTPGEATFIHCSPGQLDAETAINLLQPVLENPAILKTGQNLKYDILVLKNYGITLSPTGFDTMIASYVLNPDTSHNLDDLAARHLGIQTTSYTDLVGKGKKALPIRDVPVNDLCHYACQDADLALRLSSTLGAMLDKDEKLQWLCRTIEFPLVEVLAAMEHRGIALDTQHLEKTGEHVARELGKLTLRIAEAAGCSFNIDSPKQLAEVLFDRLGLPAKKATKTGYSTNVQVLEDLVPLHPIAEDLLEYRSLQKLRSTYIEALPKMLSPRTGRLHTSFNQHITATGRLSSSNPNLQNIPVRTELGREIRKAFIPADQNNRIFSADYSQIELRIAAEISGDPQLQNAFRNGEDIHAATARIIFSTEEVTSDMRRKAKEVNFGVLYGIQPYGLALRLGIPQKEARDIIETYKAKYPGLFIALQEAVDTAATKGYVTTLLGRKRFISDLTSRNANIRKAAERAAMNTPIQGTAADIIKYAMCTVHTAIEERSMKSTMLLQVHDELVFETTAEEEAELARLVIDKMTKAAEACGLRSVPVEVDTGSGRNWLEAHS